MIQSDYDILTKEGNISFYNSTEVTELFLIRKKDNAIINFYTLIVFEEKPFEESNHKFLCKPILINKEYSLGIQRYWMSLNDIKNKFERLYKDNIWGYNGNDAILSTIKLLPKQYIPSTDGKRLNSILKNNFHNGSYILEGFDEDKTHVEDVINKAELKKALLKVQKHVSLDLEFTPDRIGNIIFQFPITILNLNSRASTDWDGIRFKFFWHSLLNDLPDCLIHIESSFDDNLMGAKIEDYNKKKEQEVKVGSIRQLNSIKIWRREPSLILNSFNGTFISGFDLNMRPVNSEPRIFTVNNEEVEVYVSENQRSSTSTDSMSYKKIIQAEIEKNKLEKSLSFNQYFKVGSEVVLKDLHTLIQSKGTEGVYLLDPFLTSLDILNTLFYCTSANVPLKAIGSYNSDVKGINSEVLEIEGDSEDKKEAYFQRNRDILDNPNSNNFGLNLEFRLQFAEHGKGFHDRFLIFPEGKNKKADVYSLGTSVNSLGNKLHIIQQVSRPQEVLAFFNELWNELDSPECIVWKTPIK